MRGRKDPVAPRLEDGPCRRKAGGALCSEEVLGEWPAQKDKSSHLEMDGPCYLQSQWFGGQEAHIRG